MSAHHFNKMETSKNLVFVSQASNKCDTCPLYMAYMTLVEIFCVVTLFANKEEVANFPENSYYQ
jgi:hypothetical protein